MHLTLASAALSAFALSTLSAAQTVSRCPISNVCYQVGVPETSVSSGSGNIYMQLKAPTSYSWVALGTGQQMAGANIFVIYADGAGNVTISARKGTGEVEPQHQTRTQLELLAGSGIVDNGKTMLANLRCANCESWDGGSLSLSSTRSPFIAAWKKGSALNSKSASASLDQHDAHDQFTFDLTRATITNDQNPFVSPNNGGTTTPPSGGNSGGNSDSSPATVPSWISEIPTLECAHGIIMSIVMVILFPLGALLMTVFHNWMLHAAWQMVSFIAMWAGFAIGVILSQRTGYGFNEDHTKLGTVVVALLGIQPIVGYLHHLHYLKHQKRGAISYAHIWYGRILIVLGIINGGLGLQLADAKSSLVIAYSVIAAIVFLVYVGGATLSEIRRHRGEAFRDDRNKRPGA